MKVNCCGKEWIESNNLKINQSNEKTLSAQAVGLLMLLPVFIAPSLLSLRSTVEYYSIRLGALVWGLSFGFIYENGIEIDYRFWPEAPKMFAAFIINNVYLGTLLFYAILRLVFVVMMVRYYKGHSDRFLTLFIGTVSEIYFWIVEWGVWIPALLSGYIYILLPTPFSLLTALLILRLRPPKFDSTNGIESHD